MYDLIIIGSGMRGSGRQYMENGRDIPRSCLKKIP